MFPSPCPAQLTTMASPSPIRDLDVENANRQLKSDSSQERDRKLWRFVWIELITGKGHE